MNKTTLACVKCKSKFLGPDSAHGKTLDCPKCKERSKFVLDSSLAAPGNGGPQTQVRTGLQQQTTAKPRPNPTRKRKSQELIADLRSSFKEDRIRIARPGTAYMIASLFVTLTMLLIPLLYIGLIVGVCFGVYFHATHNNTIFMVRGGGIYGAIFKFVIYAAPFFGGFFVVLSLLKPVFARPWYPYHRRFLTKEKEPVVFWFVEEICRKVGCRPPRRIYISPHINASAELKPGFRSFFSRSDLALTIGMSLVACLNTQQFAGILAHEFGHFSQKGGMRLTFITHSINSWLYRVATSRDAVDRWLEESVENETHWALDLLLMFAMFCVWLARWVMVAFMYLGHAVCCGLMRQMEYNADRFEIKLVGVDTFMKTSMDLVSANAASDKVFFNMLSRVQDRKANRKIPQSMAKAFNGLTPREVNDIHQQELKARGGLFESHPTTKQRIEAATKLQESGIFVDTRPARELFINYEHFCTLVSEDFYRTELGVKIKSKAGV